MQLGDIKKWDPPLPKKQAVMNIDIYLRQLIEFIGRYLQQFCCRLTSTPCENFCSLICKSDFQMESTHNFSITIVMTEAAFHNSTRCLVNKMATKRVWKFRIDMTMCNLVKPHSTYLSTSSGRKQTIISW